MLTSDIFNIVSGQSVQINSFDVQTVLSYYIWPFVRILAMIMVAPVFSASMVLPRVRVLISIMLTLILVPLIPPPPPVSLLSVAGGLVTAQQVLIGIGMGFALQVVFDALILGGQAAAMSMGLGFAIAVDPARGVNVPVVSQYFMVLATLAFLAINGHIVIIDTLAKSFQILPVGEVGLQAEGIKQLIAWTSHIFYGALKIALPAMTALMIVNLGFGVISRAAPTLNLFAIGFPITMLLGFIILMVSVPNIIKVFMALMYTAFEKATVVLGL
ncbi:MAG: flagellar biosynthetic protein FliR [Gammaproteobacteria bacterium]